MLASALRIRPCASLLSYSPQDNRMPSLLDNEKKQRGSGKIDDYLNIEYPARPDQHTSLPSRSRLYHRQFRCLNMPPARTGPNARPLI